MPRCHITVASLKWVAFFSGSVRETPRILTATSESKVKALQSQSQLQSQLRMIHQLNNVFFVVVVVNAVTELHEESHFYV